MALRLTVDYREASLVVDTDAVEPTTAFTYAKASVTHQLMQALSAYELVALSDIYLDPDTLNKWFTALQDSPDALTVTISEALAQSTSLSKADVATMSEAAALASSIGATDSYTVGESLAKNITLAPADTPTLSEALALVVSIPGITDSFSLSEAASLLVSLAASDAFALDDLSSVSDVLKTDVSLAKGNVTTLLESSVFSFGSIYTDSATMSEDLNFQVVGRLVNSATFNASVLN